MVALRFAIFNTSLAKPVIFIKHRSKRKPVRGGPSFMLHKKADLLWWIALVRR
jgi:hypothetical protein